MIRKRKRGVTPPLPSGSIAVLDGIYFRIISNLVSGVTKISRRPILVPVRVDRRVLRPFLGHEVGWKDRLHRARGLAGSTIDANFRVDVEHRVRREIRLILPGMDAVDGT